MRFLKALKSATVAAYKAFKYSMLNRRLYYTVTGLPDDAELLSVDLHYTRPTHASPAEVEPSGTTTGTFATPNDTEIEYEPMSWMS